LAYGCEKGYWRHPMRPVDSPGKVLSLENLLFLLLFSKANTPF